MNDDRGVVQKVERRAPTEVEKIIGQRIRLRRRSLKLSQEALGEVCGLSPQQIHKYENGFSRISVGRLMQLAEALGATVEWFFEGLGERQGDPDDVMHMIAKPEYTELMLLLEDLDDNSFTNSVLEMVKYRVRSLEARPERAASA
ncbi:MAG: helix-turn-helix transcriptional regulator [Pseudomonadota bacterium]